jgi:hypothetical protein
MPVDVLQAASVVINAAVLWKLWEFTMATEKRITACETRLDSLAACAREVKGVLQHKG